MASLAEAPESRKQEDMLAESTALLALEGDLASELTTLKAQCTEEEKAGLTKEIEALQSQIEG